ncbi:MAG: 4Fe-4S binding protein [Nanoarchaeota archaeon]|nr:4Fe-4S binding protein [Nanoarchaeota archaeon]
MEENKKLENLLRIQPKKNFKELCSGCVTCEAFCHAAHYDTEGQAKSAIRIDGKNFPNPGGYNCTVCNQCGICAKACPADAIKKEGNIYKIDKDLCVGCTAPGTDHPICVDVCPKDAVYTHKEQIHPIKCDGCGECVEICPTQALEYVFKKPKAEVAK